MIVGSEEASCDDNKGHKCRWSKNLQKEDQIEYREPYLFMFSHRKRILDSHQSFETNDEDEPERELWRPSITYQMAVADAQLRTANKCILLPKYNRRNQ